MGEKQTNKAKQKTHETNKHKNIIIINKPNNRKTNTNKATKQHKQKKRNKN